MQVLRQSSKTASSLPKTSRHFVRMAIRLILPSSMDHFLRPSALHVFFLHSPCRLRGLASIPRLFNSLEVRKVSFVIIVSAIALIGKSTIGRNPSISAEITQQCPRQTRQIYDPNHSYPYEPHADLFVRRANHACEETVIHSQKVCMLMASSPRAWRLCMY